VKTWLFTTLHRLHLESRRRHSRFPHFELDAVPQELPSLSPATVNELDAGEVLKALGELHEAYQGPVALFYLEDCSYKEIAEILDLPMGTVKSRMARGIAQLQQILSNGNARTRKV
jgi:RNA polymerase sigma-70 factor (ECF subfamily)